MDNRDGRRVRERERERERESQENPFGLVSLFNGISTLVGYLMTKPFSKKNSSGTI